MTGGLCAGFFAFVHFFCEILLTKKTLFARLTAYILISF